MMLPALATAFQPRSIQCHPLLPVTARLTESDFLSSPGASLRSYALTAPHGDFQPPLTRQRGRLSGPTGRILTRKQRGISDSDRELPVGHAVTGDCPTREDSAGQSVPT
jgi:hypothetical protein